MWVKVTSRKAEGVESYKIEYARDAGRFPDPQWPTRTLDELLEVTFRNANIDTDNHPGSAPPDRREAGSDVMPQDGFRTIVVVDFEYEIDDGDLPRVLCMVAYVLDAESPARWHHQTSGAASSARHRHSISAPIRCSSATACGPR